MIILQGSVWGIDDVMSIKEDWTAEQAAKFIEDVKSEFEEQIIVAGNELLLELITQKEG